MLENARCPICMDRAVSAHKGAAFEVTFAAIVLRLVAMTCAPAPRASCDTRRERAARCHVPDAPYSHGCCAASAIRPLVEKRPTGPHVAQALYELGFDARARRRLGRCATKPPLGDATKRGHARAALALAACFAEGKYSPGKARRALALTAARRGSADGQARPHVFEEWGNNGRSTSRGRSKSAVVEAVQRDRAPGSRTSPTTL